MDLNDLIADAQRSHAALDSDTEPHKYSSDVLDLLLEVQSALREAADVYDAKYFPYSAAGSASLRRLAGARVAVVKATEEK